MAESRKEKMFKNIKKSLETMLDALNTELEDTVELGVALYETKLRAILSQIDASIINNPSVKGIMISGSQEDRDRIKEIIEDVQKDVKEKIEEFTRPENGMEAIDKNEAKKVEAIYQSHVKESKTVKTQSELDKLDGMEIKTQDMKTRYEEADKKVNDLSARIAKATLYKKVVNLKSPAITPQDLKDSRRNTENELNESRRLFKEAQTMKSAADYEEMFNGLYTRATEASSNPYRKEDFIKFNDILNELRKLTKETKLNPDVAGLITEIDGICVTRNTKGLICSINPEKLKDTLLKFKEIKWDKATEHAEEAFKEGAYAKIETLLKNEPILKMRPKKLNEAITLMNGRRKDDDDVFAYMEKFILDTVGRNPSEIKEIENNIDLLDKDSKDTTLATQLNDAMMIRNNLGIHKGKDKLDLDTTKLTVLGHTFENVTRTVVDDAGNEYDEIVDFSEFANLSKEEQDEIMEALLEQIIPYDSNREPIFSDEINDRYGEIYEEFKPKGIFGGLKQIASEAWYSLRYGQTKEESRKMSMVAREIRNAIEDVSVAKANEDSKKSWELTPQQLQEQQDKQQEFAAKASKSARESVVKNGKSAKDAHKEAQKQFNKEQDKYDSGLENEDEEIDLF